METPTKIAGISPSLNLRRKRIHKNLKEADNLQRFNLANHSSQLPVSQVARSMEFVSRLADNK